MNKFVFRINQIFFLLFACILGGCGFNAQTINHLPANLHNIYFQADAPYDLTTLALKRSLQNSGASLFNKQNADVKYKLHLSAINFTTTQISVNLSSQARVYILTLDTTLTLSEVSIQKPIISQKILTTRSVTLEPNEMLASSNQIPITKEEMRQELVIKIMNIIKYSPWLATGQNAMGVTKGEKRKLSPLAKSGD